MTTPIADLQNLQSMLREIADLPRREAEAAAEASRQQTNQQLNRDIFDLEALAGQCQLVEAEITAGLQNMIDQIDRSLANLPRLQQLYNRANDLAQRIGQARCILGQQSFNHTGRIMQADVDHEASVILERVGLTGRSRLANVGRTLATLREQLTASQPPDVLTGKVLIKKYIDGKDVEYWG